jgi:hypothetical protein
MTTNGSKDSTGTTPEQRFIRVYNDTKAYPTLQSVADALGRSKKTVVNTAAVLRSRIAGGEKLPALVARSLTVERQLNVQATDAVSELDARDHARLRATQLTREVHDLLTRSLYPVINPAAVSIESHVVTRYDRVSGGRYESESTPRTWISDTLRVQGVPDPAGRRFIFSGAQNDTPVDPVFWENLTAYATHIGAEIIIGPWTYETSWWSENTPSSRVYDPVIADHLCFGQMALGKSFLFAGEMNTLPTANKPVSDLVGYARGHWAVFPHAKIQLVSVPSSNPMEQAFQVMTTGAVTRPKVIPRKAGVKSIAQHQLGATLVEFDAEGDLFCRQLIADATGSFYDLDRHVSKGRVTTGHRVRVLTPGDIHVAKLDRRNALATFGNDMAGKTAPGSMLDVLNPEVLAVHDLHDHEARNHHHAKDVSHNFEMAIRNRDSIVGELERALSFLKIVGRPQTQLMVIDSNHDLALERYVREGRYRMDGQNFRFGLALDCAYHDWRAKVASALDAGEKPEDFSLLEWALRHLGGADIASVAWVYDGRSCEIDGVQIGYHGFRGCNGAKGSVAGYARLGHKITIGDKHSPSIMDDLYGAGCMALQHGYNKGPSGWAVAHVVQYANGTRCLVTLQNGKWRAPQGVFSR